jgi:DNA-directed RNA polymerase subunit N
MLIPVRCFTCGKVLANKYLAYERMCAEDAASTESASAVPDYFFEERPKETILDKLELTRVCCRRHMLTCVKLVDII